MSQFKTEDSEPSLKFLKGRDEITGDEYDGTQRVQMSCGHGVDPGSLTAWCRSLIDQGHFKLHCPADVAGGKCGAEWSYPEVRRSAVLGDEEQLEFEKKLALIAARLYCDFKECPSCKSLVERKDPTHLRVWCTICTSSQKRTYEFCWQCLRAWKGQGTPSDHCANEGCVDPNLQVLANCGTKDLPGSEIRGCPSTRACPTCGLLIEHKDKCKYVLCSRCHVEFCFACLDMAQACKAAKGGAWFLRCAKPPGPKAKPHPCVEPTEIVIPARQAGVQAVLRVLGPASFTAEACVLLPSSVHMAVRAQVRFFMKQVSDCWQTTVRITLKAQPLGLLWNKVRPGLRLI